MGRRRWGNALRNSQAQTTPALGSPRSRARPPTRSRTRIRRSCLHPTLWCHLPLWLRAERKKNNHYLILWVAPLMIASFLRWAAACTRYIHSIDSCCYYRHSLEIQNLFPLKNNFPPDRFVVDTANTCVLPPFSIYHLTCTTVVSFYSPHPLRSSWRHPRPEWNSRLCKW